MESSTQWRGWRTAGDGGGGDDPQRIVPVHNRHLQAQVQAVCRGQAVDAVGALPARPHDALLRLLCLVMMSVVVVMLPGAVLALAAALASLLVCTAAAAAAFVLLLIPALVPILLRILVLLLLLLLIAALSPMDHVARRQVHHRGLVIEHVGQRDHAHACRRAQQRTFLISVTAAACVTQLSAPSQRERIAPSAVFRPPLASPAAAPSTKDGGGATRCCSSASPCLISPHRGSRRCQRPARRPGRRRPGSRPGACAPPPGGRGTLPPGAPHAPRSPPRSAACRRWGVGERGPSCQASLA